MRFPLEMRPVRIRRSNEPMGLEDALAFARERIDPASGWLLAECPEKLFWQRTRKLPGLDELRHCRKLYIFDNHSELRMQKDGAAFFTRRLWEAEDGEEGLERLSSCLLRQHDAGRLLYAEFFRQNAESGMLELAFGRLRGVLVGEA